MLRVIRRPGRYAAGLACVLLAAAAPLTTGQASAAASSALSPAYSPAALHGLAALGGIRSGRLAIPAGLDVQQVGISITYLDGVFCTAAANCWAVGVQQASSGGPLLNQVRHWNGHTWRRVTVPNPGGTGPTALNELFAVRCVNPGNCFAVGEDSPNRNFYRNEALHWNGKKWHTVPTPNPGGTKTGGISELFDVTCTSSVSCWSVGEFGFSIIGPTEKLRNQVLHWNGRRWSQVRTPDPGGIGADRINELFAIRCGSAGSCNAGGTYGTTSGTSSFKQFNQVLHWNGRKWMLVHAPQPGSMSRGSFREVNALACGSPANCWGAGNFGNFGPPENPANQMLHWNGRKWTRFTVPSPDGTGMSAMSVLIGATCSSTSNCWAVGGYEATAAAANQALHWNGTKWALVKTPNPAGSKNSAYNFLYSARCTSTKNCWAVGIQRVMGANYGNEILHWNGKKWSSYY